ncbi:MAG: hypothetical protein ACOCR0_01235, partial [Haloferacaceae archaeon]
MSADADLNRYVVTDHPDYRGIKRVNRGRTVEVDITGLAVEDGDTVAVSVDLDPDRLVIEPEASQRGAVSYPVV